MTSRVSFLRALVALGSLPAMAAVHAAPPGDLFGASRPLHDVAAVKLALGAGLRVSAAVNLALCQPANGGAPSQTQGGLLVSPYRIQADGTLSFSDSHFTVSNAGKPITQFLRYVVRPDNAITVTSYIFSMPDLAPLNEAAFNCQLGNGVSFTAGR
jgi:hypothetical protein